MLRNGRTFYSAFFYSKHDLLQREHLEEFIPKELVRWDQRPEIHPGPGGSTIHVHHGLFYSEKKYSSDEEFLKSRYDDARKGYMYNFFVIKYEVDTEQGNLYLVAAPLKQLAGHLFAHLFYHGTSVGLGTSFKFKRIKLTKLLDKLPSFLTKSPRLSVPMIDFYVYGDGGSDDVKISGSDPKKSKVYKALSGLAASTKESERIIMAPCSLTVCLDYNSPEQKSFEVYYKGIFSFNWERDNSHLPDVFFVIHTLNKLGIIENTTVRPNWLTDRTSKRLLKAHPDFDKK
jgi:hypothetical protein